MGFTTALIINTAATLNFGVMFGHHLIAENLNNTHPYIQYEKGNFGTSLFYNSFERVSLSGYYKAEFKEKNLSASLRIGVSTGYSEYNMYQGRRYQVDRQYLIKDNLLFTVVPEIKYKFDNDYYVNSMILGDSISIGLGYSF